MRHELIKTDDYLLVVSDEKIKKGDFIYETNIGECSMVDDWYLGILKTTTKVEPFVKVIAHLPLNNSPILEGVDLLPPLPKENHVEELSVNFVREIGGSQEQRLAFVDGYLEAKETYKYTEEDLRNAFISGEERILNKTNSSDTSMY